MRIRVKDSNTNLRLWFPNGILLNRLTAGILVHALRNKNFPFTQKQLMTIIKAAKTYKHHHPDWVLVEVDGHDGDQVMVKL